jgi:hypothetical protein
VSAVQADHALVERVLRESHVVRELPPPGLADYLVWLVESVLRAFASGMGELLDATVGDLTALSRVLAVALLAALLAVLVRLLAERWRRPVRRAPRGPVVTPSIRPTPAWDGTRWRAELEARLGREDARGALEALWWWLAHTLAGARAERSWTSRELLARSGRAELGAFAARLDRLAYGTAQPRSEDVRLLAEQLRAALA